jgi:hypothetical protein
VIIGPKNPATLLAAIALGTVTRLWAGRPRNRGSVLGRGKTFIFSKASTLDLGPAHRASLSVGTGGRIAGCNAAAA